jgi:hypothetical protein
MSNSIDAVGMVRRIRDDLYEQTKNLSAAELVEFYRRRGSEAREKLMEMERQHTPSRGAAEH